MSDESSSLTRGVLEHLKKIPSWVIALVIIGFIVLAAMSYQFGSPFRVGETLIGFAKCNPNSCIDQNGKCGTVKLTAWCANDDKRPHGCGTEFPNAFSDQAYFTDANKLTKSPDKRAGVKWVCVANKA